MLNIFFLVVIGFACKCWCQQCQNIANTMLFTIEVIDSLLFFFHHGLGILLHKFLQYFYNAFFGSQVFFYNILKKEFLCWIADKIFWSIILLLLFRNFAALHIVLDTGWLFAGTLSVLSFLFSCSIIPCSSENSALPSSFLQLYTFSIYIKFIFQRDILSPAGYVSIANQYRDKWTILSLLQIILVKNSNLPRPGTCIFFDHSSILLPMIYLLTVFPVRQLFL